MYKPIVMLDNGHGIDTEGKRSPVWPDGKQLFEYEFNRDIVSRISTKLALSDIPFEVLVPEITDISLPERVRRANEIYSRNKGNAYLLSVHANAGGGTGWEIWTSTGKTASDDLAEIFFEEAYKELIGWRMRNDYSDGDADKESLFYILRYTKCPAVLTENLFMDTERDCRYIMSDEGRKRIARMHVEAIKRIYQEK